MTLSNLFVLDERGKSQYEKEEAGCWCSPTTKTNEIGCRTNAWYDLSYGMIEIILIN
jgi:hypothetical protein